MLAGIASHAMESLRAMPPFYSNLPDILQCHLDVLTEMAQRFSDSVEETTARLVVLAEARTLVQTALIAMTQNSVEANKALIEETQASLLHVQKEQQLHTETSQLQRALHRERLRVSLHSPVLSITVDCFLHTRVCVCCLS